MNDKNKLNRIAIKFWIISFITTLTQSIVNLILSYNQAVSAESARQNGIAVDYFHINGIIGGSNLIVSILFLFLLIFIWKKRGIVLTVISLIPLALIFLQYRIAFLVASREYNYLLSVQYSGSEYFSYLLTIQSSYYSAFFLIPTAFGFLIMQLFFIYNTIEEKFFQNKLS
jgi:hypothetical protein